MKFKIFRILLTTFLGGLLSLSYLIDDNTATEGEVVVAVDVAVRSAAVSNGETLTNDNHGNHDNWQIISTESNYEIENSGYYYLEDDVDLDTNITISTTDVVICLNGKILKGNGNNPVITLKEGSSLTLYDCQYENEEIKNEVDGVIYNSGVITNGYSGHFGGGIYATSDCTITMFGGTIANNYAFAGGGGFYLFNSTLTMYDGTITNNSTAMWGGGLFVVDSIFNFNGGEIYDNDAFVLFGTSLYIDSLYGYTTSFDMSDGYLDGTVVSSTSSSSQTESIDIYIYGGTLGADAKSSVDSNPDWLQDPEGNTYYLSDIASEDGTYGVYECNDPSSPDKKHNYQVTYQDGFQHYYQCIYCESVDDGSFDFHSYYNNEYYYDDSYDADNHYQVCDTCGYVDLSSEESHGSAGYTYEDTKDGYNHFVIDAACGYYINTLPHYYDGYVEGDNGHYQVCEFCYATTTEVEHSQSTYIKISETQHEERCSDCNALINTISHDDSDWSSDDTSHYKYCETCDANYDEAVHTYEDGKYEEIDRIYHYKVCDTCGYADPNSAEEHYYSERAYIDSEDGRQHKVVDAVCGHLIDEEPHNFEGYVKGENGHYQVCKYCFAESSEEAHTTESGEYQIDGDTHYQECLYCGARLNEEVHDELTSSYYQNNGTTDYHDKYCSLCNGIIESNLEHEYNFDESGNWYIDNECHYKLCECGDREEYLHEYKNYYGEGDYHHNQCSICGYVDYTGRAIHSEAYTNNGNTHDVYCSECYQILEADVDHSSTGTNVATCTSQAVCDDCGVSYGETLDHDYTTSNNDETSHWTECSVCGDIDEDSKVSHSEHEYVNNTDDSHTVVCSCGITISSSEQHTTGDWLTTDDGQHYKVCGYCDAELYKDYHVEDYVNTDDETTHNIVCSICEEVIRTEDHSFGEWVVTTEPSETETGEQTKTCEGCGYYETEVLEATGETETPDVDEPEADDPSIDEEEPDIVEDVLYPDDSDIDINSGLYLTFTVSLLIGSIFIGLIIAFIIIGVFKNR